MKEKISCSLDGEIVKRLDDILDRFPFIQGRSALIEMAIINLQDDIWIYNSDVLKDFMFNLYERRYESNAQTTSES